MLSYFHIPLKCFDFVGFDIAFMYSKMILQISSRTNILLQAVLTGYQVDNVIKLQ